MEQVFKRFRHWVKADVFKRIFDALSGDPDLEFAMVDGTIVKVHRHGQGAKGGSSGPGHRQVPRGLTTKILALTDALGNLVRFELLPGQRHDTVGVAPLIEDVAFGGLIADKAFDASWIVAELDARGAQVVLASAAREAPTDRRQPPPVASPHRELLLQAQGVQTHRPARL